MREPAVAATVPDMAAILASVGELAYGWDVASDRLTWGANAGDVLKVKDPGVIATGRAYAQLVDAGKGPSRYDAVVGSAKNDDGAGVPYRIEYCFRPGPDSDLRLWLEDSGRWFAGTDGKPARAHGVLRVVNERHEREQRLAFLAQCDGLTGELNRWHMVEVLLEALDEAVRARASCGFLLVAIDNLSQLNDAYGYVVVDQVISAVAQRLRGKMRGDDSLGRYSGNKFGVILKKCTAEELSVAAERLLAAVRDELVPTSIGPIAVTVTIGGVTAPRHAGTVEEIMGRAHHALGNAKAKRRGSFQAYRPNVERDALRRVSVRTTDEIVTGLNERRVALAFEPVVHATTRELAFYECLMRMNRADGGIAQASEIIPIAERVGLVRLLDHRVLELVVNELAAAPTLHASVNVSPGSTTDPDWWNGLDAMLRAHSGVAERLTVEITETAAIHDIDDTRGFVTRVKDLGCRIAIDDFGAGYTSFRNLRKLGVDIVKIDGTFVKAITRTEDDRTFVQMLIDLAHRLKLTVVAEWVQDEATAAMLAGWGCDYLQGELVGLASVERGWVREPDSIASA